RLARSAHEAGVPVVYFVSPQVWAWKPGRVRTIAENVERMLVIFPFEEEFYRRHGVRVTFVGHPLLDLMPRGAPRRSREERARLAGIDPRRRIIGLLPGSRMKEVRRHLTPMLDAARRLSERIPDLAWIVPVASTLRRETVAAMVDLPGAVVHDGDFYEAMSLC